MAGSGVVPVAAVVAACLIGLVVAFQVALAAGAPWGAAAYGGRFVREDGSLPTRYRVSSAGAAFVLAGTAWVVLAAGSVLDRGPLPEGVFVVSAWVLACLFALNTLANLGGRHPVERFGFGAVTALVAVLCAVIALQL